METIIAQNFKNHHNGAASSRVIRIVDGVIVDRYAAVPASEPDREWWHSASPSDDGGYVTSNFGCGELHTREWGAAQKIKPPRVVFDDAE